MLADKSQLLPTVDEDFCPPPRRCRDSYGTTFISIPGFLSENVVGSDGHGEHGAETEVGEPQSQPSLGLRIAP